ncbi:hypothetical protein QQF64_013445 [Cirrhinus molitorella]|uniref:Uncharacterized protein n=1 Tax=Cirrhinus molitorella TaxID=172907 RepID=A0ABR3LUH4_9TELE
MKQDYSRTTIYSSKAAEAEKANAGPPEGLFSPLREVTGDSFGVTEREIKQENRKVRGRAGGRPGRLQGLQDCHVCINRH